MLLSLFNSSPKSKKGASFKSAFLLYFKALTKEGTCSRAQAQKTHTGGFWANFLAKRDVL